MKPPAHRKVDAGLARDLGLTENEHASLLNLVDNLLNKGVVVTGELILGLGGIDLVYIRLAAVLAAADRALGPPNVKRRKPLARTTPPVRAVGRRK